MPEIRFVFGDETVARETWPAIPRVGDIVRFDGARPDHAGDFRVDQVRWHALGGGELQEIVVMLVPGW